MRLKITLTLLAILLGLLTYIFYIDSRVDDRNFAETRKSVLGNLVVGVDYLSIQNNTTGQNITFKQENKRWTLTQPYEWPANEFAVQRILNELSFLERVSTFETDAVSKSGASLADYGLSPPQLSVVFGHGQRRATLGIGKPTDIGNNLYVLSTDQSKVHVVNRSLLDSLSINLDDLRSSRLFDIAVFEATSWNIQVRDNTRNLRAWFARSGDNWVFETPIRARADSAAVNTLLNRCLNLEADSIVASNPSDLSPYGLQSPLYRIAVESEQQREVLEIGAKVSPDSEIRYAKRESRPTVFQLRIHFLDILANAQTKLRERRIFEIDVQAATTATIERRDEQAITLQKLENGKWEIIVRDESEGIQTIKGDTKAIEEMLLWLDELKAIPDTGFVNDAPSAPDLESYGLEVPEYSITITSNRRYGTEKPLSTPESETLLIGDRSPRDRLESFVKIESKDFVYSVYNDVFRHISIQPAQYKDRSIVNLPEGAKIDEIEITRISDGETVVSYQYGESAKPGAQGRELAQLLSKLSAESFLPGGFTRTVEIAGRERPWAYKLTATLSRDGRARPESETFEMFISETSGGPLLYGGIYDRDIAFRFEMEFVDAFTEIIFDRKIRDVPQTPFSSKPLPEPGETEALDQQDAVATEPAQSAQEAPAEAAENVETPAEVEATQEEPAPSTE